MSWQQAYHVFCIRLHFHFPHSSLLTQQQSFTNSSQLVEEAAFAFSVLATCKQADANRVTKQQKSHPTNLEWLMKSAISVEPIPVLLQMRPSKIDPVYQILLALVYGRRNTIKTMHHHLIENGFWSFLAVPKNYLILGLLD